MYFSLSTIYERLECVDLKEKNRKQMYDQIKKNIRCCFLNFVLKKFKIKNKLLKNYGCTTEKDELL